MIAIRLTLISLIISTNALSIGTVSGKNVTKRETNLGDLFPDWVPFKNKHGEELGEFVQVKSKPKKRLALPINFILRAVAEPEVDDYYEKEGGGGSDSDDYYEKKEWSDTNRPVPTHKSAKPINHPEISEIDGVVNIITKRPVNPVVEALKRAKQKADKVREEDTQADENEEGEESEKNTLPEDRNVVPEVVKPAKVQPSRKKARKYEEEADYEDDSSTQEKRKPDPMNEEQEKIESEANKVRILNTVDELKQRHAKEQVAISEKAKEEEMYQEQREREKIQVQSLDSEHNKYDDRPQKLKKKYDYDDYEDSSLDEKYKTRPYTERTNPTTTKSPKRTTTTKKKEIKEKKLESGKLSVFKNPQLYMVYDYDSDETTTIKTTQANTVAPSTKFSAKYSLMNGKDAPDRISLVPENEGKEGEPALFFPKKRRNKKIKTKDFTAFVTIKPNAFRAEVNVTTVATDPNTTGHASTGTDTTGSDSFKVDTTIKTETSGSDLVPTRTEPVTDAITSSTQHHKAPEMKEENYHREKGK